MNFVYLIPFTYSYATRLREGIAFHAIFEWGAAALMVVLFGPAGPGPALWGALVGYAAFISLYEIGYLYNDLVASKREAGGRHRGPQGTPTAWLLAWCAARLVIFAAITVAAGKVGQVEWWSFFGALACVFTFHNLVRDVELRVTSFAWLAWFRFMSPIIFVVAADQRLGVGLAAAMAYVFFRGLSYLDAKSLLRMQGRKSARFRLIFFLMPLVGAVALWPYREARGFVALTVYFAVVAAAGVLASAATDRLRGRSADEAA